MITVHLTDGRAFSIHEYLAEAKEQVDLAKGLGQKIAEVKARLGTLNQSLVENRESLTEWQRAIHRFYVSEPEPEAIQEKESAQMSIARFLGYEGDDMPSHSSVTELAFDRDKARQAIIQLLEDEE